MTVSGTKSAESRVRELGLTLPPPPSPLGAYRLAVQSGNLLFLSGILPTRGHEALLVGRLGKELDVAQARSAAHAAALNALAAVKQQLGSLDRVTKVVRLGVSIATDGDVREHPRVADAASELLRDVFGDDKVSTRLVLGVASLPLGVPIELELVFEIGA